MIVDAQPSVWLILKVQEDDKSKESEYEAFSAIHLMRLREAILEQLAMNGYKEVVKESTGCTLFAKGEFRAYLKEVVK